METFNPAAGSCSLRDDSEPASSRMVARDGIDRRRKSDLAGRFAEDIEATGWRAIGQAWV
jgi:hypothetical protein